MLAIQNRNNVPPQIRARIAKIRRARQQGKAHRVPESFRDFIKRANPRFQFYQHCEILINVLQDVADGKIKRLMIFEPPRHGKSELVSRLFPAYMISEHQKQVGLTAHTARLAKKFSRDAQNYYLQTGGKLDKESIEEWYSGSGGGLWAAGVGGPITGMGCDLGIIDDPTKNAKDAGSSTIRENIKDWYGSTFYTRMEPDAAIIITNTRWNEDDLSGSLIKDELLEGEDRENWTIVSFPAIKEDESTEYPENCTVIPDFRKTGEVLCPERYPLKKLKRIMRTIGSYFWNALYQQRPSPAGGGRFKSEHFRYFDEDDEAYYLGTAKTKILKRTCSIFQTIDTAGTESETSDYFVCGTWAITTTCDLILLDIYREKVETTRHEKVLEQQEQKWQPFFQGVENKIFGINIIQKARDSGRPIKPLEADGSKILRSESAIVHYENGKIYHRRGALWLADYESELLTFPKGKHDDQVDMASYAAIYARSVDQEGDGWGHMEYLKNI